MKNSTATGDSPKAEQQPARPKAQGDDGILSPLRLLVAGVSPARLLVGYSGGLDSTVLLHAAHRVALETGLAIQALHFDHGLSAHSTAWADSCAAACEALAVPLAVGRAAIPGGGNLEERARRARYAWFSGKLADDDLLLLAHHRGDQAETVLYNLLRGCGVNGAAAMPALRRFARGRLGRPLLELPRAVLEDYADRHRLSWIDDPANAEPRFDRNFLRHSALPLLAARFPRAEPALARAAANFSEAAELLAETAAQDLAAVRVDDLHQWFWNHPVLDVAALRALGSAHRGNLLRAWLAGAGAPPPPRSRLDRLQRHLLGDRPHGSMDWSGLRLRRYRERLYLSAAAFPVVAALRLPWRGELLDLTLPGCHLIRRDSPGGLSPALFDAGAVTVRFGGGHRALQVTPGGPHRDLRKLYQEHGVAPWLRDLLPKIYLDDSLVAVAGVAMAAACRVDPGAPGWVPAVACLPHPGAVLVEAEGALW